MKALALKLTLLFSFFFLLSCTASYKHPLGSAKNPIKIFFVPSVDVKVLKVGAHDLVRDLEKLTPYKYKVSIPASYVAVMEALGSKRADFAFFGTFPFLVAKDKYNVKALFIVGRYGRFSYRSEIVARADSGIKSIKDLNGKKIAFVDPSSTSGYVLPNYELKKHKIKPSETTFAQRHDNVLVMLYQKQVDAGAVFYSPPTKEGIQDARRLVKTQYPNIEKEVKIIHLSEPIPNEPIVARAGIPAEIENTFIKTMLSYIKTKRGKDVLGRLALIMDLRRATDADYRKIRSILKVTKQKPESLIKKK